jgi:hypothetical protein
VPALTEWALVRVPPQPDRATSKLPTGRQRPPRRRAPHVPHDHSDLYSGAPGPASMRPPSMRLLSANAPLVTMTKEHAPPRCPDEVLIPRILGPDRSLRTKRLDGKPRTADPADLLSDEHPVAQEPDLRTIPTGLPASTGPTDARSNQYSDSISSLRLRPRLAIDTPFVIRCVATSTGTHGSRADQHGASGEASRKKPDRPSVAGTTTRGEQTSISG